MQSIELFPTIPLLRAVGGLASGLQSKLVSSHVSNYSASEGGGRVSCSLLLAERSLELRFQLFRF